MWLGFLGELNPPPGDPPPSFDDEREGPDDRAYRPSRSRYVPARSRTRIAKYAWLISVVVHVLVLVGIYLGYRAYLHRPVPIAAAPAPTRVSVGSGLIVPGDGAASLVLGGGTSYFALGPASLLVRSALADEQGVPRSGWQSRPTFDGLGRGVFSPGAMIGSPGNRIVADLSSSRLPRRAGAADTQPSRPRP